MIPIFIYLFIKHVLSVFDAFHASSCDDCGELSFSDKGT